MYYPGTDSDSDPKSGDDPRDPDYTPPGEYITAHCAFWARAGLTLVFKGLYEDRMGAYNLHITRRRESARPWKRHSAPRPSSEERFLVGLVGPVGLVEPKARA